MLTPQAPFAQPKPEAPSNGAGAPQAAPMPQPQAPPPQPAPAPQEGRPPTVPLAAAGQRPTIAGVPTRQQPQGVKKGVLGKVKDFAMENKGLLALSVAFIGGLALRGRAKKGKIPGPPEE